MKEKTNIDKKKKKEINKALIQNDELTAEEKLIVDYIRESLRENDIKYIYDIDNPRSIEVGFEVDNKPLRISIILQDGKVNSWLFFPFRVQMNAIPIVAMYIAEFNTDKSFGHISLDMQDGELSIKYSYILEEPERFEKREFWIYMLSLIKPSLDSYTTIAHLSMGVIPEKSKKLYKILLENALKNINGDYDEESDSYGIESISTELCEDN